VGRPILLFWAAAGGATLSLGIAWHEFTQLAAGNTRPLDVFLFVASLAILAGTVLVAGRILYLLSRPS